MARPRIDLDPDDIDDVVVDRLCRGERVKSNKYERIEAVRILRRRGARNIPELVGLNNIQLAKIVEHLDSATSTTKRQDTHG